MMINVKGICQNTNSKMVSLVQNAVAQKVVWKKVLNIIAMDAIM